MISETDVERAVEYLRDNARKAAQARANREYLEAYLKTVKAQIMQKHYASPLGAQEREAYADDMYTEHLKAIKQAVEEDEYHRWMMAAAEAKISAWQTMVRAQRIQDGIR